MHPRVGVLPRVKPLSVTPSLLTDVFYITTLLLSCRVTVLPKKLLRMIFCMR